MTRLIAFVILLLAGVTSQAFILPDSIKINFEHRLLSPLEGVWQIPDGAVLAIERSHAAGGDYAITLLQSPDLRMPTPAVIGCLKQINNGDYTISMATNVRNGILCDKRSFNAKLRNNGDLELKHKSPMPKIRISMMLRFLGPAVGITKTANPTDIDLLATRIYPAPGPSIFHPIAL